jgi:sec-independent protein translocase protein TatB
LFGVAWDRWLLLVLVALFGLGPERLPAAIQRVGRSIRQVKSFAAGAQEKLNAEIGPELAELRKPLADLPLAELRRLRNPGAAVVEFLLADHDSSAPPAQSPPGASALPAHSTPTVWAGAGMGGGLASGERPPTNPDAT